MTNRKKLLITGVLLGTLAVCCACGKTEQQTTDTADAQNTDTKQEQLVPEHDQDIAAGSADTSAKTDRDTDSSADVNTDTKTDTKTNKTNTGKLENKNTDTGSASDSKSDSKKDTAPSVTTTSGKTAVVVSDAQMTDCFTISGDTVSAASDSTAKTGNVALVLGEKNGKTRILLLYGDSSNRYGYVDSSALSMNADTIRKTSDYAKLNNADCYEVPEEDVTFTYTGLVTVGDDYQENWCPVICVNSDNQDYVYVQDSDLSYSFDAAVPDISE